MNYYNARQIKGGEGWHYTCMNDNVIWAVGYCRDHDPHATADGARECFRRYLLDAPREENYSDWTGCEFEADGKKCDTPTKKGLAARPPLGHGYALCDEHRTPGNLEALTPPMGQMAASY